MDAYAINRRKKEFQTKRIETLSSVWETLKNIEEDQRSAMHGRGPLPKDHIQQVNLLLMRSAPFLLEDEREWAIVITQSILEINTTFGMSLQDGGLVEEWWPHTDARPVGQSIVAKAASELSDASEALAHRYAEVMRGEHN